jgi:hypothetical protein
MRLFAGRVDEPLGLERVVAGGSLDFDHRALGAVLDLADRVLPADRVGLELADALDQEPLEIELLQVDERRLLGVALVLEVERVELVGAREGPPDRPGHAFGADLFVDAQALEDLEALLRIADAARRRAAHADGVVLVEDDDLMPRSSRSLASVRPERPAPAMTTG